MLPCCMSEVSHHRNQYSDDRELLYSNSVDEDPLTQVRIQPFWMELSPTSEQLLTQVGEQTVINLIQKALNKEFAEQTSDPLDYVFLADLKSVTFHNENATTTLKFQGGVSSFTGGDVAISQEDVNAWVKSGVETKLVGDIFVNTLFQDITSVRYQPGAQTSSQNSGADDGVPTMQVTLTPTESPVSVGGVQEGTFKSVQAPSESDLNVWALVGSLIGLAVVVLAVVLIVQKRRNRAAWIIFDGSSSSSDSESDNMFFASSTVVKPDDDVDAITVFEDEEDNRSEVAQYTMTMTDSQSVHSEFTLDDSRVTAQEPTSKIEPFQQERQVTLKKDMLGNEWSGANDNNGTIAAVRASTGRRKPHHKEGATFFEAHDEGNDASRNQASGFRSMDQGEEIFLVPPRSSTSKM